MNDILPDDGVPENYDNVNVEVDDLPNANGVNSGRQERDRVIRDHFANLE